MAEQEKERRQWLIRALQDSGLDPHQIGGVLRTAEDYVRDLYTDDVIMSEPEHAYGYVQVLKESARFKNFWPEGVRNRPFSPPQRQPEATPIERQPNVSIKRADLQRDAIRTMRRAKEEAERRGGVDIEIEDESEPQMVEGPGRDPISGEPCYFYPKASIDPRDSIKSHNVIRQKANGLPLRPF